MNQIQRTVCTENKKKRKELLGESQSDKLLPFDAIPSLSSIVCILVLWQLLSSITGTWITGCRSFLGQGKSAVKFALGEKVSGANFGNIVHLDSSWFAGWNIIKIFYLTIKLVSNKEAKNQLKWETSTSILHAGNSLTFGRHTRFVTHKTPFTWFSRFSIPSSPSPSSAPKTHLSSISKMF